MLLCTYLILAYNCYLQVYSSNYDTQLLFGVFRDGEQLGGQIGLLLSRLPSVFDQTNESCPALILGVLFRPHGFEPLSSQTNDLKLVLVVS